MEPRNQEVMLLVPKGWNECMKDLLHLVCLIALVQQCGCASCPPEPASPRIWVSPEANIRGVTFFTRNEVKTRQWVGLDSRRMELLAYEVRLLESRTRLAIARYGSKNDERVSCVDIYTCTDTLDGEDALSLICHDQRIGWVTALEIQEDAGCVYFEFTRDIEAASGKLRRNRYSYTYSSKGGVVPGMSDFYWEVQP